MPVRSHIFAFTPATVSLASTSRFKNEYVESKTSMLIAVAMSAKHASHVAAHAVYANRRVMSFPYAVMWPLVSMRWSVCHATRSEFPKLTCPP